jgi:hypothetical protein
MNSTVIGRGNVGGPVSEEYGLSPRSPAGSSGSTFDLHPDFHPDPDTHHQANFTPAMLRQ